MLISASRGLLVLRDPNQSDRLKKLRDWSANGHADRSTLAFNRAITEIVERTVELGAALLPLTGSADHKANIPQALAATRTDTAGDLRDVKRDQAMTRKALNILVAGGPDAYEHAVAALREDTRSYWQERLAERRDAATAAYAPTADMLKTWIERHWEEWYDDPIVELENRDAIRDQAIGAAYAAHDLDMPVRYEVHLDRKLERTLTMLFRLKELRQPATPA
jgi:hypothetical protein